MPVVQVVQDWMPLLGVSPTATTIETLSESIAAVAKNEHLRGAGRCEVGLGSITPPLTPSLKFSFISPVD